jgi:hypothetical protein
VLLDPGALRERGDRRPRDLRVVIKAEVLEPFQSREPGVDQPAFLSSFGPLSGLGL